MEAYAISAANLSTIENNLGYVAKELSGVINNVNSVNDQMSAVEKKVTDLDDELKGLVQEIKQNTIITNARQAIMYNNTLIEKKYVYFDTVRRNTEAILDAIQNSNIKKSSVIKLRENILLNNPNYWLSNALAALISWILDDKENTNKELNNALRKNRLRTSIFFALVNVKLKREQTALNWLNSYLGYQDPLNLSEDFVTILDMVSNNAFGSEGKEIIISKINNWIEKVSNNKNLEIEETNKWLEYIQSKEYLNVKLNSLIGGAKNKEEITDNLLISSTYEPMYSELQSIVNTSVDEFNIDKVLNNLLFKYEKDEEIYQDDNFKNQLIIECNGDTKKADELYDKQKSTYGGTYNILTLINNLVIYKDRYNINQNTQKLALYFAKKYIMFAFDTLDSHVKDNSIEFMVNDLELTLNSNINKDDYEESINTYLTSKFNKDNSMFYILLAVLNILGIFGCVLLSNSFVLVMVAIIVIIVLNGSILFKMYVDNSQVKKLRLNKKGVINSQLERVLAEYTEYKNMLANNNVHRENLKLYLNNLTTDNFIKHNGERNLDIGGQ